MHAQVLVDQIGERHRRRAPARSESRERLPQCYLRFCAACEAANLRARRTAAVQPVAVGPERTAIRAAGRQLEHLTLLNHRDLLDRLIGSRNDNLTSPEDHLLPLEGVTLVDPETREAVTRDRYEDGTLVRTQVCEIGDRR